jgi:molybdenum cofactor cytidylyltransferase
MTEVAILLPAAGASSRMRGGDKLLEPVDGEPLLARQIRHAQATGARVLVTLPPDRPDRAALCDNVETCLVPDAARGMSGSLRAGASWAVGAALLVMLPDMPEIETQHLLALIDAFSKDPARILRAATPDLRPGHPVIFPPAYLPLFATLNADEGARQIIAAAPHPPRLLPLPGSAALLDLDTPEDWAAWRALPEA